MTLSAAVIGAGPSGFYTAHSLINSGADCCVDLIEMLPAPFGLIRSGVAPDHQGTKGVVKSYEKTAAADQVAFFGNIEVGRDVSLDELREIYDAVVLATGAPFDRGFEIIGGGKRAMYGAAQFVGWYNGDPRHADLNPALDTTSVGVVGNGNVALDVARMLVKTRAEMAATDLPEHAANAIHASPVTDVYLFGRRGPEDSNFTNTELRELAHLEDCAVIIDADVIPDEVPDDGRSARERRTAERNLATLRELAAAPKEGKSKRLHFVFFGRPVEVLGGDRIEGLRLEHTYIDNDGETASAGTHFEIPMGMLVAAIGYRAAPIEGVPLDDQRGVIRNTDGRVLPGVYAAGWAKRGPSGVIGSNRPDGEEAANNILADIREGTKVGRPALESLLRERGARWVSFDDWKEIDEAEIAAATNGAPREKIVNADEMLAVVEKDA
ncbi:MAG: hypothetical protein H8E94_03845 [Alphaproteobacteria bacterium]|nr:hypothetical protein [Alphaproteobacteria bacterium]